MTSNHDDNEKYDEALTEATRRLFDAEVELFKASGDYAGEAWQDQMILDYAEELARAELAQRERDAIEFA